MAKVFVVLAVCIAVFIALQVMIGMHLFNLPPALVQQGREEIAAWEQTAERLPGQVLEAMEQLERYRQPFAAYERSWQQDLESASDLLEKGATSRQTLDRLLTADDPATVTETTTEIASLVEHRLAAEGLVNETATAITTMATRIVDRVRLADECRALVRDVQGRGLTSLEQNVAAAIEDWPDKAAELSRRLQRLRERGAHLDTELTVIEREASQPVAEMDIRRFSQAIDTIQDLAGNPEQAERELADLCRQLSTGWDEILTDMNIVEGESVTFFHTTKRLVIADHPGATEDETINPQETVNTRAVTRNDYERHKDHLGMAIRSKPVGHFDHEVETVAQPPGYSYIATPEQGRNRYGHWQRNSRGESFWEWYGRYAFMRSLFWGDYYRPIYVNGYRNYHRDYTAGRSYFGVSGAGRRYGSSGTFTKRHYGSSKYVRTGGLRNSQYVKSGGTYRGRPKQTSTSSYRQSSWGGGRSGGGK